MLRFILCDDDELQLDEIAGFIRQWADTNKLTWKSASLPRERRCWSSFSHSAMIL